MMEDQLADEKPQVFQGATLQFDPNAKGPNEPEVSLNQNRPISAVSNRSVGSKGSKTTLKYNLGERPMEKRAYFSNRPGAFENAVEDCKSSAVKSELDGGLIGAWLLTEIDHWDNEKERLVLLTDNSLLVVRYDFVAMRYLNHKRVMLHFIDSIQFGDLTYPAKSIMSPRNHGGVRLVWTHDLEPTFLQRWNPFSSNIPYMTFAHHPVIYHDKDAHEAITYNVDDFYDSLVQATTQCLRRKNPGKQVRLEEDMPILIETYASVSSMVFNQSFLGFSRDRNGVSF